MGNTLANIERLSLGGATGLRVAPAGRVIRSAGRPIIPSSAPANSDAYPKPAQRLSKLRFASIAFLGISCGVLISLAAPSATLARRVDSPQYIFSAIKSNFLAADRKVFSQPDVSPRQARVSQAVQRVTAHTERESPVVPLAGAARQGLLTGRLASYSAEATSRVIVPRLTLPEVAPEKREVPIQNVRALVGRVHSIIKKYAPQHKSPSLLAHAIVRESTRQGVDPLFVAAVIKSESTFNVMARSNKGATGLMQIMPATGAWLAQKNDLPRGKLTDPGHNLRLGISYLKHLEDTFQGNRVFTLVAYNWGPGHVESAAGGKRRIPKECMTYALKIMSDYKRWSSGVI